MGERTTLDVLNAQQELVNARVALVTSQHDRVVASYTLLWAAVGGLSVQRLGLNVPIYDPARCTISLTQVRDAWIGLRIPDGEWIGPHAPRPKSSLLRCESWS